MAVSFLDYVIQLHNNEVNYLLLIVTSCSQMVRSFALILHICQLGEVDENGIVRLNIDFLICIKLLFYGQIWAK
jgi:hypothetical protein